MPRMMMLGLRSMLGLGGTRYGWMDVPRIVLLIRTTGRLNFVLVDCEGPMR